MIGLTKCGVGFIMALMLVFDTSNSILGFDFSTIIFLSRKKELTVQIQKLSFPALMPIFQNTSTPLRFLTDDDGIKTDVVLSMKMWEDLIQWLEDIEDRILVQSWTPHLRMGPQQSGALKWADITDEWMSDEFENIADQLADEFTAYLNPAIAPLSDYAVSREGIYSVNSYE